MHHNPSCREGDLEMGARQRSKRDVAERMRERYLEASRAEKGKLLEEFVELTGYRRTYARTLFKHGPRAVMALEVCAEPLGWPCGKRLEAALPEPVLALELGGELRLVIEEHESSLRMGSATMR